MGEEKMISEREAILRERGAWMRGMERGYDCGERGAERGNDWPGLLCLHKAAAREFPFPKRVVPRVVTDCENTRVKWRWVQGAFEILGAAWMEEEWTKELGTWKPTAERIRIWADLIANPTEEVDDDGSDRDA